MEHSLYPIIVAILLTLKNFKYKSYVLFIFTIIIFLKFKVKITCLDMLIFLLFLLLSIIILQLSCIIMKVKITFKFGKVPLFEFVQIMFEEIVWRGPIYLLFISQFSFGFRIVLTILIACLFVLWHRNIKIIEFIEMSLFGIILNIAAIYSLYASLGLHIGRNLLIEGNVDKKT